MNVQKSCILAFATLCTLHFASNAYAQDAAKPDVEAKAAKAHSVNLNPLGFIFGSYALNYEYLHNGTHGFLIEPHFSQSSGSDGAKQLGGGLGLGYRFHWSGEQDSGFVGLATGYTVSQGEATVETTSNGNTTKTTFDTTASIFYIAPNIGRRWAWDSGFNITLRAGAGYGNWKVETDSKDEGAQDAVEAVDKLVNLLPFYIDGELSIGWIF